MSRSFILTALAYVVPTFPLGYFWHLSVFAERYQQLAVYRTDLVIPLGLAAMVVQAIFFAWAYPRLFGALPWRTGALRFGLVFGALVWAISVLPVAAKHPMASVSGFFWIETAFVAVHFAVVSPLIAWAASRRDSRPRSALGAA